MVCLARGRSFLVSPVMGSGMSPRWMKAEEVIHQLNANPDLVPIKRKVFGKKNRQTVLEVVFAYKGRLYFRKGQDRRVEVLAVGTKNTQERELEFLANL